MLTGDQPERDATQPRRLLATDLDGTFIGDDDAMHRLWADLDDAGVTVVFSTGRHIPSIEQFYSESGTARRAEACVCMVGTEVWHHDGGGYRRDQRWSEIISEGWDKESVEEILATTPGATMQADEWQSEFKSSYFLEDDVEVRLGDIRRRLEERGLRAKVVHSAGKYLDLLPFRSGKGEAVRYLAESLGVAPEHVVTAGDTGNDIDMMRPELGFRSIAVGNSTAELAVFDPPNVYHAEQHHAAGIREGLVHLGWLSR